MNPGLKRVFVIERSSLSSAAVVCTSFKSLNKELAKQHALSQFFSGVPQTLFWVGVTHLDHSAAAYTFYLSYDGSKVSTEDLVDPTL